MGILHQLVAFSLVRAASGSWTSALFSDKFVLFYAYHMCVYYCFLYNLDRPFGMNTDDEENSNFRPEKKKAISSETFKVISERIFRFGMYSLEKCFRNNA